MPEVWLAPMAAALAEGLGKRVRFVEDCIGVAVEQAVDRINTDSETMTARFALLASPQYQGRATRSSCTSWDPSLRVSTACATIRSMIWDAVGMSSIRSTPSPAQTTRVAKSFGSVAR